MEVYYTEGLPFHKCAPRMGDPLCVSVPSERRKLFTGISSVKGTALPEMFTVKGAPFYRSNVWDQVALPECHFKEVGLQSQKTSLERGYSFVKQKL